MSASKTLTLTQWIEVEKAVFLKSNHRWKKDEYGKVDWFAHGSGFHNGPECEACGYGRCVHCNSGDKIPECPKALKRKRAKKAK